MASASKESRGFTLIEVLVAFVILAMTLGISFQIFSTGFRATRVAGAYATATMLAQSKLAALGVEEPLEEGESIGEFDEQFQWRLDVRPYEADDAEPAGPGAQTQALEVALTVSWGKPNSERSISLETLRLAPGQ